MSLVSRHLARHAAAALAGTALDRTAPARPKAPAPVSVNPEYAALLEQLGEDLRTLSNIQSVERKIETKAGMIDRYRDWIDGALRAGKDGAAVQDEIVATMLVWSLDLHEWTAALQLGAHVLTHGIEIARLRRTAACLIAEEIAEASLKDVAAVDHGTLIAAQALTDPHDMPDEVRAKLMKAIGRKLMADADAFDAEDEGAAAGGKPALLSAALDALTRARSLDAKVGVAKDIETLGRELKKLAPPT